MTDDVITVGDMRNAGYCVSGIRNWCAAQGLDFRDVVRRGIPRADFLKIDCQYASRVLQVKAQRNG